VNCLTCNHASGNLDVTGAFQFDVVATSGVRITTVGIESETAAGLIILERELPNRVLLRADPASNKLHINNTPNMVVFMIHLSFQRIAVGSELNLRTVASCRP
jgi:hypothetical protein